MSDNIKSLILQNVFGKIMKCVKSANGLPSGQDFDFYSSFQKMKDVLDYEGNRLLKKYYLAIYNFILKIYLLKLVCKI